MTVKELDDTLNQAISASANPSLKGDLVIKTFEDNQDFILNTDINTSEENYYFTTLLISNYAHALFNKERRNKALPFLNRAIPLWENDKIFEDVNQKNNWYSALRFDRGVANYYKYNLQKAKEDFVWLTNYDPENDKYKIWLKSLTNRKLEMIANGLLIIILPAVFIDILLPRQEYDLRKNLNSFVIRPLFLIAISIWMITAIRKWKMKSMK